MGEVAIADEVEGTARVFTIAKVDECSADGKDTETVFKPVVFAWGATSGTIAC